MSKIKAILFDFDGTIIDTNQVIINSWQAVFQAMKGRDHDVEEIVSTFGEPLFITMERWFPGRAEECIQIYRNFQKDIFFDMIKICPGMDDLIKKLKLAGYKNAIVTSRLTSSTMGTLEKYDLARYFDAFVTCDDTKKHKPDPEPVLIALEKLGISADEAIMIGDSKFDIECARNAGVKQVLVDWSITMKPEERTGRNAPTYLIEKAEDLFEILC